MATIVPVITPFSADSKTEDQTLSTVTWANIHFQDTCQPISLAHWADRSIQVDGTFTNSVALALQGSNTNTNYYQLNDPGLNAISKTAAGLSQVLELTTYVKPVVSNGDSSTLLTVTMVCRRPQHLRDRG